jgi:hypothetical protein
MSLVEVAPCILVEFIVGLLFKSVPVRKELTLPDAGIDDDARFYSEWIFQND